VLDDLDEEFAVRVADRGRRDAVRWYRRQVWRSLVMRYPVVSVRTEAVPAGGRRPMFGLSHDLRYALRRIGQQPGFALAAVLTLALGVGANAAVFRVAWQVVLKRLPYPAADRLVRVWEAYDRGGRTLTNMVSPGNFVDWQNGAQSFQAVAAYNTLRTTMDLTGAGDPVQLDVRYVTGEYFRVFGQPPLAGRTPTAADAGATPAPVVLSEHLWRARFGADPAVVGRTIHLTDMTARVVGVMPESFGEAAGPTTDVWMAFVLSPPERQNRGGHYLGVVARLRPGVSVAQADAELKAVAGRASRLYPDTNRETSATVVAVGADRGGTMRPAMALLAGAAALVLVIACANLAGLQLASGLGRAREFAIRAALGASRGRVVRQVVVESLVVAGVGGAVGLALSSWVLGGLARVAPVAIRRGTSAGIDAAALATTVALALASVALFAVVPAWQAARRSTRWMHQRAVTGDRRTAAVRTALVTGQLALAVMLLIGAGLLVVSLGRVLRVDPGFDPEGVLAFDVTLPYEVDAAARLVADVTREVQAVPGVTAVCAINTIPFDETFNMTYVPVGQTTPVGAFPRTVTPACFDVLHLRLLGGRLFTDHETTRVGIVTESFARRAWGAANAVGRQVHLGVADGPVIDIVGVIDDSLQRGLDAPVYPQFYEVASAEAAFPLRSMLVRTAVPPGSLFGAVRAAVRRVDPRQPVGRLRTLDQVVGASAAEREFNLDLLAGFALIALVLSAVGIYGLFAHVVAARRAEIGIRMALGAAPSGVIALLLRRAWLSVSLGLAAGVAGAALLSGLLRHMVFGLSATDPRIYAGATATLGLVALVAAWIPSRRAARVDPVSVLRNV
jgi:putative ABC transport system permease protein